MATNTPKSDAPLPGDVFWENGRLRIIRHCDGVFELQCDGKQVMPTGPFEYVNRYLWAEFDVIAEQA